MSNPSEQQPFEPSIKEVLEATKESSKHHPLFVICPRCDDIGRINVYRPYRYNPKARAICFVHRKIPGTWGAKKTKKRSRCYLHSLTENEENSLRSQLQEIENSHRKILVLRTINSMSKKVVGKFK